MVIKSRIALVILFSACATLGLAAADNQAEDDRQPVSHKTFNQNLAKAYLRCLKADQIKHLSKLFEKPLGKQLTDDIKEKLLDSIDKFVPKKIRIPDYFGEETLHLLNEARLEIHIQLIRYLEEHINDSLPTHITLFEMFVSPDLKEILPKYFFCIEDMRRSAQEKSKEKIAGLSNSQLLAIKLQHSQGDWITNSEQLINELNITISQVVEITREQMSREDDPGEISVIFFGTLRSKLDYWLTEVFYLPPGCYLPRSEITKIIGKAEVSVGYIEYRDFRNIILDCL